MTGYARDEVVPFNCNFLQGEGTDPATVDRIRRSIRQERDSTELILNYRKDGTPFWNLIYISPLRSQDGSIKYFIGGQIDVTRILNVDLGVPEFMNESQLSAPQIPGHNRRASIMAGQNRGFSSLPRRRSSFCSSAPSDVRQNTLTRRNNTMPRTREGKDAPSDAASIQTPVPLERQDSKVKRMFSKFKGFVKEKFTKTPKEDEKKDDEYVTELEAILLNGPLQLQEKLDSFYGAYSKVWISQI